MINVFMAVLCTAGMLVQLVFIYSEYRKKMVAALWLKGLASAIFVSVGVSADIAAGGSRFADTVVAGLAFGAIGDVFLNLRYLVKKNERLVFAVGVVSFFLGHVMYLIALLPYCDHIPAVAAAGLAVAGILVCCMFRKIKAELPLKIFGGIYITTVALMATVAMGNLVSVMNPNRVLFAVGALFFLASDTILVFNTFGPKFNFCLGGITLILYYIGQSLIALSAAFVP